MPEIEFAKKDPNLIVEAILGGFEAAWYQDTGEVLLLRRPDARRMFLLYVAQIVVQQRVVINFTGRMNLLKYMRAEFLDGWGGNWGERGARLPASRALTTLRFAVPGPLNFPVVIPAGTLVAATAAVTLQFETTAIGTIPIGQLSVDVPARCTEEGTIGNDFLPGQINRLVNFDVLFAINVANTSTTAGGAERQDDDPYRDALWNLPESFATCGPSEAYEWWAKHANPAIINVAVHSAPVIAGEVHLYSLLTGGLIPSDEILEQVYEMVSARRRRPVADWVFSERPEVANYNIDLDWYGDEQQATVIASTAAAVATAVDEFVLWTKSKITRDIIPDELIRRVLNAGAKRTVVRAPVYRPSAFNEVAIAQNITLNFAGLEPVL
ncbi:MAG: baseplate J/gp47 family protein [Candidatus Eremiobacteraeota bacterium]|nr:baseplate J/gp47 family protein [Candidatus Eremiobacteraeota bacterium]